MTRKRKKRPLKKIQWRIEYGAFLLGENVIRLFSIAAIWRTGARLSGLARFFAGRRNIVRSNLRTVLGLEASEAELDRLTGEVFRHTSANLLTALKGAQLPGHLVRETITYEGEGILENAIAAGKGVIILSAHMGNFELLTQALGAFRPELKVAGIYRPLNNIHINRIMRKRRARRGMKLFAKLTSYHGPIKWVRNQGILGIIADQRAGRVGTITPFFGRLMSMSPLPAFIHRHTGASIIGVSMETMAPGRWKVAFHSPALAAGEEFTAAHMARLLERMIRRSIIDVFWLQDLYRYNEKRPLEIPGRKGPLRLAHDRDRPLHPFSVLVRVPDNPAELTHTIPALDALVASRPDLDLHLLARERVREASRQTGIPHTFHSIEEDQPLSHLRLAIALTSREREARELIRHCEGLCYAVPEALQGGHNWRPIPVGENMAPSERWLEACRSLGMHDPPLEWTYA